MGTRGQTVLLDWCRSRKLPSVESTEKNATTELKRTYEEVQHFLKWSGNGHDGTAKRHLGGNWQNDLQTNAGSATRRGETRATEEVEGASRRPLKKRGQPALENKRP